MSNKVQEIMVNGKRREFLIRKIKYSQIGDKDHKELQRILSIAVPRPVKSSQQYIVYEYRELKEEKKKPKILFVVLAREYIFDPKGKKERRVFMFNLWPSGLTQELIDDYLIGALALIKEDFNVIKVDYEDYVKFRRFVN